MMNAAKKWEFHIFSHDSFALLIHFKAFYATLWRSNHVMCLGDVQESQFRHDENNFSFAIAIAIKICFPLRFSSFSVFPYFFLSPFKENIEFCARFCFAISFN